jgi:hypothetical protein
MGLGVSAVDDTSGGSFAYDLVDGRFATADEIAKTLNRPLRKKAARITIIVLGITRFGLVVRWVAFAAIITGVIH